MWPWYSKKWDKWKKNLTKVDYGFVKLSCIVFGIFFAALFPQLLNINMWWWLAIALVLTIKPLYTIFNK